MELAQRNRSDSVLQALFESGGMIGLSMYPRIAPGGVDCTLELFCDMAARTAERFGIEHIGIGSDLYIGQPAEKLLWWRAGRWAREPLVPITGMPDFPEWFRSPADFPNIARGLQERGFKPEEIEAVMGGNWLRFFTEVFEPA